MAAAPVPSTSSSSSSLLLSSQPPVLQPSSSALASTSSSSSQLSLLQEWTKEEVHNWFERAKGGKWQRYADCFEEYDGAELAQLVKQDFIDIIGPIDDDDDDEASSRKGRAVATNLFNAVLALKALQQAPPQQQAPLRAPPAPHQSDASATLSSSTTSSQQARRRNTRRSLTNDSWARSSSPAAQEEPGQQAKVGDEVLEILHINKPTLAPEDTFTFGVEIHDPLLESWIVPVFLHQRFRLPKKFLEKYPHLRSLAEQQGSQTADRPMLCFTDGLYGLGGLPDSFSFDLRDRDFRLCANMAIQLAMVSAKRLCEDTRANNHGEGTHEMELYAWLYACFSSGCSDYLDRAWRGTLTDDNFPSQHNDLISFSREALYKLANKSLLSKQPITFTDVGVAYGRKRWQPDGIIGYTKKALEKLVPLQCCLAETVYLGLVAIEHKKDYENVEDLNMLAYEMHLICKMQQQLGIEHPLAFGVYWAGVRFMLYCMEVRNERFVPIQLLQYSCDQDAHVLLVFRALWYLRLHGIHMAHLAKQGLASFQEKANVYPVSCDPTSRIESEGDDIGDTDESTREGGGGGGGDDDEEGGPADAPSSVRVVRRNQPGGQHNAPVQSEAVDDKIDWQPMSEMEIVTSCYNSGQYWVSSQIIHQSSRTMITLGKSRSTDQLVALKRRLDGDPKRLKREAEALDLLRGCNGIVQMLDMAYYDPSNRSQGGCHSLLVLEHVKGRPFIMHAHNCSRARLRFYFYKLIKALTVCHQHGIVHHDIKPGNVLITDDDKVVLIDFDHAVFLSTQKRDVEGCTAGFTPPELKSGSYYCSTGATDAWGVGIMLLQSLLWTYPITDEAAWSLVEQLHLAVEGKTIEHLVDWIESTSWDDFRFGHPDNDGPYAPAPWCSEEGLDLARQLLHPDPWTRLDLADALNHPFLWPPHF